MFERIAGILGLALAALGLIAQYRWQKVARWVTDVGLATGCILVGVALAPLLWSVPAPSSSEPVATKPDIHFVIPGGDVFVPEAPDLRGQVTGLVFDLRVWNTGRPAFLADWKLTVVPVGRMPEIAQLTRMPPELRAQGPINSAVILGSDSLVDKTKSQNVTEVPIEGKLLFYVNLTKSIVQSPDTRLVFTLEDEFGNSYTKTQLMGDWWHR